MSRLSTHVLDTAIGVPAAGIKIELFSVDGDQRKLIKEVLTNMGLNLGQMIHILDHILYQTLVMIF